MYESRIVCSSSNDVYFIGVNAYDGEKKKRIVAEMP